MDFPLSRLVYENVCKMLVKRGGIITSPLLSEDQIVQQMSQREYIMITATRSNDPRGDATITAVIIDKDSSISKTAKSLSKILALALKQKSASPLEILLVTKDPMQERLMKQDEFKTDNKEVTIANYTYDIFLVDITEHVSVPKHELANEDEISEFCKRYHTSKEQFSKIPMSDPQAVWLGLQPGMVIRILRASETAGEAPTYRICIK